MDPDNSKSDYNFLSNTSNTGKTWTHECRVTITDGGDSSWGVGEEVSYYSFKIKVDQLSGYGQDPPQGNVFVQTTEQDLTYGASAYTSTLVSPTGNDVASNLTSNSRPYWGLKHSVQKAALDDPNNRDDFGCLEDSSGTYSGTYNDTYNGLTSFRHEWQITTEAPTQYLYRYTDSSYYYANMFQMLGADPDGYPCWNKAWVLDTDITAVTTSDSVCPADADWNGTGLSIALGEPPPVTIPTSGPSNVNASIEASTSGISDLTAEIAEDICTESPISINGYYPIYTTESCANQNGNGTSHTHEFDGVTYYMPNGVTNYHGDYAVAPSEGPSNLTASELVAPASGPTKLYLSTIEAAPPTKYKGYVFDPRTSSLSGPFVSQDISAVTTKDNSSEMYAVNRSNEVIRTVVTDLNNTSYASAVDPFTDLSTPLTSSGVVMSKDGKGFVYRNRYKSLPFAESVIGSGSVENPLYFKDGYLSIAETNWLHLGDEHNEKQIHRVDLRFHKNSVGHLFLYVQNDDGMVKGQYKGALKEHMKVFTNLRGRGFQICMMIVAHKDYPWAMREMAIGHLYGKSF